MQTIKKEQKNSNAMIWNQILLNSDLEHCALNDHFFSLHHSKMAILMWQLPVHPNFQGIIETLLVGRFFSSSFPELDRVLIYCFEENIKWKLQVFCYNFMPIFTSCFLMRYLASGKFSHTYWITGIFIASNNGSLQRKTNEVLQKRKVAALHLLLMREKQKATGA